jgi:hypothetical protein
MCYNQRTIVNKHRSPSSDGHLNTFSCGKCVKCINKYRTEWAFRMHQESKDHATAYFVTLTYDEENLPYLNATTGQYPVRLKSNPLELQESDYLEKIVYKKDVQDFLKNLRRQTQHHVDKYDQYRTLQKLRKTEKGTTERLRLQEQYKQIHQEYKIRYYFTSEYGTKSTKRPHYHGIVWNLQPPIARKLELQKIWTKGNTHIRPAENNTPADYYYLTKYIFKQRNYNIWTFPPFQLMSQKPFIGSRYLETHREYHMAKGDLITPFNKREILIPRIYRDKFPKLLKDITKQKIFNKLAKEEKKGLSSTKQNHHYDILQWFKQQTAERQAEYEQQQFEQKFKV